MAKKKNPLNALKENTMEIILESISDGVFTVNHNWKMMSFNRAAEEITGIARKEAIGRHCWEVFRSNMCESDCALKKTMKEGKSFINSSTYIIDDLVKSRFAPFYSTGENFSSPAIQNEFGWFHPHLRPALNRARPVNGLFTSPSIIF